LDEPLGALDLKLRKEMQIELKRLQREVGITFVYVTHDQEEALTMSDRIAVMSRGDVLQIGDATEIYERPTSRFVADFIGETNFLEGKVTHQEGATVVVTQPSGLTLHAQSETPLTAGTTVAVAVRPEKLHLQPLTDATNCLPGRVTNVIYIGTDTQYEVRIAGDQLLRVRAQNDMPGSRPLAQEGDEVTVCFSSAAARVLMG